jgi:ABC-type uncharacterized transport system ATPase subunit
VKRIIIEVSDEKFDQYTREVGEIIGIATFIEADVRVEAV